MAAELTLFEVGVLFGSVALVGLLATRLHQSVIPFYIVVGMALNPYVAGRLGPFALQETEFIELGAELGIVFLLFYLGLEFNLDRFFRDRHRIGRAGTLDLGINFGVGFVLGYALFRAFLPAFLLAGIVYISSSAIITKSLLDLGWIAQGEADPMLGTLVFEDLVIAIYLVIASTLFLAGGDLSQAAGSIGVAMGFVLVLLLLVHFGTPLFQRVLATTSNEFVVLRAVGITVLVAGAALALGVSEAVAAFFVGMAFSGTDRVAHLEKLLEPVRDIFAAVFFFWIGLLTDPFLIGGVLTMVFVAALVTAPTKWVSGYIGGRIYELDARRSTRVALGMTIRGEFSLIIATLAVAGSGVTVAEETAQTIYAFAVGYVLVMSILGTTLMQYSGAIERIVVRHLEARPG